MKVAVVGAGMAGLAVTWYLLEKGCEVVVFDKGGGASVVSTGLLHACPGREAKLSWRAEEGIAETKKLLAVAGGEAVFRQNGILRFAVTEEQRKSFAGESQTWLPQAANEKVAWNPEGITVFSRPYLEALKKACCRAQFVKAEVTLADLGEFDQVILAGGADTLKVEELGLKTNIGQMLLCRWSEPLPMSLLGMGHITPTEDPALCQVGSTYEHSEKPDREKALQLLEKVAVFYPPAREFEVVEIRNGMRIAPKIGYKPVIAQIRENVWVFTGLGSRGLLYHALLAKELVNGALSRRQCFCAPR